MGLATPKQSGLPTATTHTHQHPESSPSASALPRLRDSVPTPLSSCLHPPFRPCFLLVPIEMPDIFRPDSIAHVPTKHLEQLAGPQPRRTLRSSRYAFCSCHPSNHAWLRYMTPTFLPD